MYQILLRVKILTLLPHTNQQINTKEGLRLQFTIQNKIAFVLLPFSIKLLIVFYEKYKRQFQDFYCKNN